MPVPLPPASLHGVLAQTAVFSIGEPNRTDDAYLAVLLDVLEGGDHGHDAGGTMRAAPARIVLDLRAEAADYLRDGPDCMLLPVISIRPLPLEALFRGLQQHARTLPALARIVASLQGRSDAAMVCDAPEAGLRFQIRTAGFEPEDVLPVLVADGPASSAGWIDMVARIGTIDMAAGLPTALATHGLILGMLARMCGRTPRRIVVDIADAQLHSAHNVALTAIAGREPRAECVFVLPRTVCQLHDMRRVDPAAMAAGSGYPGRCHPPLALHRVQG